MTQTRPRGGGGEHVEHDCQYFCTYIAPPNERFAHPTTTLLHGYNLAYISRGIIIHKHYWNNFYYINMFPNFIKYLIAPKDGID